MVTIWTRWSGIFFVWLTHTSHIKKIFSSRETFSTTVKITTIIICGEKEEREKRRVIASSSSSSHFFCFLFEVCLLLLFFHVTFHFSHLTFALSLSHSKQIKEVINHNNQLSIAENIHITLSSIDSETSEKKNKKGKKGFPPPPSLIPSPYL